MRCFVAPYSESTATARRVSVFFLHQEINITVWSTAQDF